MKITIKEPIWCGRKIGIAEDKMTEDPVNINISYTKKDGELLYPYDYFIYREKALTYPVKMRKNTKLRIIPIADLTIVGNDKWYTKAPKLEIKKPKKDLRQKMF